MGAELLTTGDKVIPLGFLCSTTGLITGAIVSGLVAWRAGNPWWHIVLAVLMGGVLGWLIGKVMAVVFLSAPGDNVLVVKAGASALPKTILSSLLGAVTTVIVLGLGYAFVIGGAVLIKSVALMSIGIALVVGVFWGLMSALL
jgi:hypothetical protein